MADDWFRNEKWNADVARRFEEKLGRARRKAQYLRIQASVLAATDPLVALQLLDRYVAMADTFDHAQAHVDRATALTVLGRIDEAADAYEAALAREAEFPKLQTQAYLQLPMLVASKELRARYGRAIDVLDQNVDRLMFAVDHFLWHASRALILVGQGDRGASVLHAQSALDAASRNDSGFRYHPTVGLVGDKHYELLEQLAGMGATSRRKT